MLAWVILFCTPSPTARTPPSGGGPPGAPAPTVRGGGPRPHPGGGCAAPAPGAGAATADPRRPDGAPESRFGEPARAGLRIAPHPATRTPILRWARHDQ